MAPRRAAWTFVLTASCAVGSGFDDDAGDTDAQKPDLTLAFDIVAPQDLDVAVTQDAGGAADAGADGAGGARADADGGEAVDDRPVGPCSRATSCGACTGFGGCGWCGGTSICVPGTATGPVDGRCVSGWAFSSVTCLNPTDTCDTLSGCGACLARSGCGWCGATMRCLTANAARNGPAMGTCGGMWAGEAAACNVGADPCASRTDCGGCTTTPGCGWCRSSLTCMSGSPTGPATGRTCDSWAGTRSSCANPSDSCNSSGNCATCTLRSNCGWCSDSDSCHRGTSSGPADRACDRGDWEWSSPLSCL